MTPKDYSGGYSKSLDPTARKLVEAFQRRCYYYYAHTEPLTRADVKELINWFVDYVRNELPEIYIADYIKNKLSER